MRERMVISTSLELSIWCKNSIFCHCSRLTIDWPFIFPKFFRSRDCKIVGTHRVLHLGSIERERVTREWASEVPCVYYGMIYLGGVYILRVHMDT